MAHLDIVFKEHSLPIEIYPRKTLNINSGLEHAQQEHRIEMLQTHNIAFACDYNDMK